MLRACYKTAVFQEREANLTFQIVKLAFFLLLMLQITWINSNWIESRHYDDCR